MAATTSTPASLNTPLPTADASLARWFEARRTPILVLALLFALFWTLLYLQFTVDDAWISFRYAKNLVLHHVWNWNATGPREEAYTSAIYTALAILPALLHVSPALFFKFVGLACVGAMLYRVRTASSGGFAALLAVLLLTVHPFVWMHAYAGLETPLYMLLIFEMALCAHRAATTSPAWVYALFLLLPLTRPEGIVFAVAGVLLYWRARGAAPKQLPWFAASITLGLFYFIARWRYFHTFLPNPFYFKLAFTSWIGLREYFIFNFGESKGYFLTLILVILLARKPYTRIYAITGLLLLLLLFAPHGMHMNYADRFYFQVAFPILLFFLIAEDIAAAARTVCVVTLICLFAMEFEYLRKELKYFPNLRLSNLDLGRRLAPFAPNHTLLTGDAGVIPYYSNWFTYDIFGLGTNRIARGGVTLAFMQQTHPDLIFVESATAGPGVLDEFTSPGEGNVWVEPLQYLRQSGEYNYVADSDFEGEYLVEFLRKDTPQYAEIAAALRQNAKVSANTHLSIKTLLLQRYVPWTE